MNDWFVCSVLHLICLFFWLPPYIAGVNAAAKTHYYKEITPKEKWWVPLCGTFIVLYAVTVLVICFVGTFLGGNYKGMLSSYFSYILLYGTLPIVLFFYLCRFFAGKAEKWQPPESRNPKQTRIQKEKDIFDLTALFSVFSFTKGYGEPLVSFLHNENEEVIGTWRENANKARITNEDRGLVVGSPGSGKTTYLVAQLVDWMQSGKSFVATDIKPEIWAILKENRIFEQFGYTDWVLNPTDPKSHHYNIFSESMSSTELNEILSILIPNTDESAEVFAENARRLLKAIILELGEKASLVAVQTYVNRCDDVAELLKDLKRSEKENVVAIARDITRTAKNESLLSSIMTSLSKAFSFLDDDCIRKTTSNSDVKLKEVLLKPKQAIFLQFEQQYKNTTATLFGAYVAHILRILQTNSRKRDDVFVALDEIINCAPIPKFLETLNTMRSAKIPTFLYFQSLEGLNRVYGDGADRMFLGACDFKAVFKISDIETAKIFSDLIGTTETKITNFSDTENTSSTSGNSNTGISMSSSSSSSRGGSSSVNVVTQMMPVFEPEKFTQMNPFFSVCIYRGQAGLVNMPIYFSDYSTMQKKPKFGTVSESLDE